MTKGIIILLMALLVFSGSVTAQEQHRPPGQADVFRGKLYPPNVILEHQDELGLTKEQFTAIRRAVVDVQASVAEHEWDLRAAYQSVMTELDNSPIDADQVLELVADALAAENEVKKLQVLMLIRIRNLLTDDQVAYLRQAVGQ